MLTRKRVKTLPIAYFNEPVFNETVEPFFDYYQPDNVISHTSNMDMLYKSVAAGDVAMITDSLSAYINRGNADIIFFPIDLPLHNNIGFLYSNTIDLSPQQQSFIDSMRQCLWAKWRNYINRNPPR